MGKQSRRVTEDPGLDSGASVTQMYFVMLLANQNKTNPVSAETGFHAIPVRTIWEQSRCNDFKAFLSVINPAPPQSGASSSRALTEVEDF